MRRTRPAAQLALFALAFASLLPFLASARTLVAGEPAHQCHRMSVDSVIDPDPAAPEGPSQPRKAPCPTCAISLVTAVPLVAPPLPSFLALGAEVLARDPALPRPEAFERVTPPSRAPPAASLR